MLALRSKVQVRVPPLREAVPDPLKMARELLSKDVTMDGLEVMVKALSV